MSLLQYDIKSNLQSQRVEADKIEGFDRIEGKLFEHLSDSRGVIREMCSYLIEAGGKRIRPLLVLHSGLVFSEITEELLNTAVSAEFIHMASLVHDDIIDESLMRRSKPSANKKWGNNFAVLCGDYLFAKAFGILADYRLIKPLELMVGAIQNMCEGEIEQANDKFRFDIEVDTYYERIARKTAIFLECCCKAGAYLGGANEEQAGILGDYGLNLGFAFQIIDDILDFCGDAGIMGKPVGEDLSQGNITLPVILLMKDSDCRSWIEDITAKGEISNDVLRIICRKLNEAGIVEEAFNIAKGHIEKARNCLSLLPATRHTEFLSELAGILEARMN